MEALLGRFEPFQIMGVVNVTPDSFSDGGKYLDPGRACEWASELAIQGADIIDIGAESTRPGANDLDSGVEWRRLQPVIDRLKKQLDSRIKISVDTKKPELMILSARSGVDLINDVSGLADRETLRYLALESKVAYLSMHMKGCPNSMQDNPLKGCEVLDEICRFFSRSYDTLINAGFSRERIWMDPGIGFGKTDQANLLLMANVAHFAARYQLAVGISRKSWMGRLLDLQVPADRDPPSKIAEFALAAAGAKIIRTHDVKYLNRLRYESTKVEI
ncbi:MAG: dihydropteroate synthase [Oligoflexales bacterium]